MGNKDDPSHVVSWSKKEWDQEQRRKRENQWKAFKFSFLVIRLSILFYSILTIFNGNNYSSGFGFGLYIVFGGWYDFYWLIKKIKRNSKNNKPKRKHSSKSNHKKSNHKLHNKNNSKKKKSNSYKKYKKTKK